MDVNKHLIHEASLTLTALRQCGRLNNHCVSWDFDGKTVTYISNETMATDINFLMYLVAKRGYYIDKLFCSFSRVLQTIIVILQQKYGLKDVLQNIPVSRKEVITLRKLVKLFPMNYLNYFHDGHYNPLVLPEELGLPAGVSKAWLCMDIAAVIPKKFLRIKNGNLQSVHPLAFLCRVLSNNLSSVAGGKKKSLTVLYESYIDQFHTPVTSQKARISYMRDHLKCINPETGIFYDEIYDAAEIALYKLCGLRTDELFHCKVLQDLNDLEKDGVEPVNYCVNVDIYWSEYATWMKSVMVFSNSQIDELIEEFQRPFDKELLSAVCVYVDDDPVKLYRSLLENRSVQHFLKPITTTLPDGSTSILYSSAETLKIDMMFLIHVFINYGENLSEVELTQRPILGLLSHKYKIRLEPFPSCSLEQDEFTLKRIVVNIFPNFYLQELHFGRGQVILSHLALYLPEDSSRAWLVPEIATAIPKGLLRELDGRFQSVHPLAFLCHVLYDRAMHPRGAATPLDCLYNSYVGMYRSKATPYTIRLQFMKIFNAIDPQTGIFYNMFYRAAVKAIDRIIQLRSYDPCLQTVLVDLIALE